MNPAVSPVSWFTQQQQLQQQYQQQQQQQVPMMFPSLLTRLNRWG